MSTFTAQFLAEVQQVTSQLDVNAIERCAVILAAIRARGGRLVILGVEAVLATPAMP